MVRYFPARTSILIIQPEIVKSSVIDARIQRILLLFSEVYCILAVCDETDKSKRIYNIYG